jgi:hypothetical protein
MSALAGAAAARVASRAAAPKPSSCSTHATAVDRTARCHRLITGVDTDGVGMEAITAAALGNKPQPRQNTGGVRAGSCTVRQGKQNLLKHMACMPLRCCCCACCGCAVSLARNIK